MPAVALTLDVSKVTGWLNDDASCRVERRAHLTMWGEVRVGRRERVWGSAGASGMHGEEARLRLAARRGRSAPETCQVAHVGDGRDVPLGDGAVLRDGGSRVRIERLDRGLQGSVVSECARAASRSPARAIAKTGEGRGARPCATDEQLVGGGQGACALPSRKEGTCEM
eukprot:scaffold110353_cov67-Phaeocystis_antarctica.AAC.3